MHRVRVLAAQEFVDLDAKALLREATDMHVARRRECQARLGAAIARKHGGASYVAVRAEQMVGVLLLVYVRPQLAAEINGYPPGTVAAIYLTSDGGGSLDSFYALVPLLDAGRVQVVNHNAVARLALQSAKAKAKAKAVGSNV